MSLPAMTISCACGAVSGTATPKCLEAGACHCVTCRKWSGGAFLATSAEDLTFADPDAVHTWTSSDWGERLSCKTCGSTLVWRTRDGSHTSVSIQLFDDPSQFTLGDEIFIDDKPAGYAFAGDHNRMTRAEVMARYADGQEAH